MERILGVTLPEDAFLQATLPVDSGGVGIRLASTLSLSAFLASSHGSLEGVRDCLPNRFRQAAESPAVARATGAWSLKCDTDPPTPVPQHPKRQKEWDTPPLLQRFEQSHAESQ